MAVTLAGSLAGCGGVGSITPLAQTMVVDDDLIAQDAEGSGSPIRAYFNDTYGPSVEENEPKARANPHNTDKSLFKLIRGAHRSLDCSFYDLDDEKVAKALATAKRKGVSVRVVTDSDNMHDDSGKLRESIRTLKAANVPVREDKRSAIMHDKFVIADRRAIWTGSTNATGRSLYWHNNNAVVVRSEDLALTYSRVFEKYFVDGQFGPSSNIFDIQNGSDVSVGGAQVQPFFSPKGGGKAAVVAYLKQAEKSIRFMTFSLTDDDVGRVLAAKVRDGLEVSGVFDTWLAAGEYSLFESLKRRGVEVFRDGNQALMHHKVIIIDNDIVITGSFNYSQNAEMSNNENFLIVRSPKFARTYLSEYKRVEHAAKFNPRLPPKESDKDPETRSGEK
jgi:phosphatidylserine/phosphatidylglycerophosphate/cardiolipin synthase-like enzyme